MNPSRKLLVAALAAALVGCVGHDARVRIALEHAQVSSNPIARGDVLGTAAVVTPRGGMYRIITAGPREVCVNGEIEAEPRDVPRYAFVMRGLASIGQPLDAAPRSRSASVRVLGSSERRWRGGTTPVTDFQACFPND
ncbi:MAG TPA: hypothetical protein VHB21_26705, partial [Minicystis sp.]|nr:hypothetical protein [Minicystis sp.]